MDLSFYTYFFLIRPDRISLFRFLLEGYDGLAVLSTVDAARGLVRLLVPDTRNTEFWGVVTAISGDLVPR